MRESFIRVIEAVRAGLITQREYDAEKRLAEYRSYRRAKTLLRLVKKTKKSGDCWLWCGHRSGGNGTSKIRKAADGYGMLSVNDNKKYVHRVIIEDVLDTTIVNQVDHLCCAKPCWRPEHLEDVTQTENQRRAAQRRKEAAAPLFPIEEEICDLMVSRNAL